jgi:hypothetical protein
MAKNYQQYTNRVTKRERQQAKDDREAKSNTGELAVLEELIEDGYEASLQVGAALKAIKDQKLWKTGYTSFASYIEARWWFGVRYANYVISAAEVVEVLGVVGGPKNAGTAREFAALVKKNPKEAQAKWAALTSNNSDPTAAEARAYINDPKPAAPPKPMEEHTRQTLQYIKIILAKYFAESGSKPGLRGWRSNPRRQQYLTAIYHYVEEQMYFSFGAYRGKSKEPEPFEEPSAEHPGPTREQLISAAIGDKGSSS